MNYYRITKYNPKLRNEKGYYISNDWTSISDVGKVFSDGVLTMEKYLKTEEHYIQAVCTILKENNISELMIDNLEKYEETENLSSLSSTEKEFFARVTDNMCINLYEIEKIVKFLLRELLWCKLSSASKDLEIEFGYDYYMYFRCNKIELSTKQVLLANGLYVELITEN